MRHSLRLLGTAGLLALCVAAPARAQGQPAVQTQAPHDHDHQAAAEAAGGAAPEGQGMMRPDMMKMMREMKDTDAKLAAMVTAMNAAKGTEKVDAIAALLTAIVQERGEMHRSMMSTMPMNMMGGHAAAGHESPKP